MRNIKFRAWDSEEARMWELKELFNSNELMAVLYAADEVVEGKGQLEFLQYTGLKDKNGKEIYEGDIVQVFYLNSRQTPEDKAYTVVIRNALEDRFRSVGKGLGEVIGNIYENPELAS